MCEIQDDIRKYIPDIDDLIKYNHLISNDYKLLEDNVAHIMENEIKLKAMEDNKGKYRDDERFNVIVTNEFLVKRGLTTISCSLGENVDALKRCILLYHKQIDSQVAIVKMFKDIEDMKVIINSNQELLKGVDDYNEQNKKVEKLSIAIDEIKNENKFYQFILVGLVILYMIK